MGSASIRIGTTEYDGYSALYDSNNLKIVLQSSNSNPLEMDNFNDTFSAFSNANLRMGFTARVPIQGWSSNAVSSEDFGSREIVVEGAGNGGTSIVNSVTDIDFTETRDTTSSWNGNQLTVPESGDYTISGNCFFTTDAERALSVFVDGSSVKLVSDGSTGGGSTIDNNSLQCST